MDQTKREKEEKNVRKVKGQQGCLPTEKLNRVQLISFSKRKLTARKRGRRKRSKNSLCLFKMCLTEKSFRKLKQNEQHEMNVSDQFLFLLLFCQFCFADFCSATSVIFSKHGATPANSPLPSLPLHRSVITTEKQAAVFLSLKLRQTTPNFLSLHEGKGDEPLKQQLLSEKHLATYFGEIRISNQLFKVIFDTGFFSTLIDFSFVFSFSFCVLVFPLSCHSVFFFSVY